MKAKSALISDATVRTGSGELRIHGRIRYTVLTPGGETERGREIFSICRLMDGGRILSAHCEVDDKSTVVRDVCMTFDPQRRPTAAAVTLAVNGQLAGSGWYRFAGSALEFEGWSAADGRISQRATAREPIRAFGTHPVQADAFQLAMADPRVGPRSVALDEYFVCSADHRGATSPELVRYPTGLRVWYIGAERISVEAGEFDAWHFGLADDAHLEPSDEGSCNEPGRHPPYDLWVTADGEFVFLRAELGGYAQRRYELVSLDMA